MVSSLLPIGSTRDLASAETGMEMLRVLSESNNLAAKDLHEKLQFVRHYRNHHCHSMENSQSHNLNAAVILRDDCNVSNHNPSVDTFPISLAQSSIFPSPDMSAGMALQSSLMEEFLTQPVGTAGSTDTSEFPLDFDAGFLWSDDAFISG